MCLCCLTHRIKHNSSKLFSLSIIVDPRLMISVQHYSEIQWMKKQSTVPVLVRVQWDLPLIPKIICQISLCWEDSLRLPQGYRYPKWFCIVTRILDSSWIWERFDIFLQTWTISNKTFLYSFQRFGIKNKKSVLEILVECISVITILSLWKFFKFQWNGESSKSYHFE